MIAKQLQNIYNTKDDVILVGSTIDTNNIKTGNGLILTDIEFRFDNDRNLKITNSKMSLIL